MVSGRFGQDCVDCAPAEVVAQSTAAATTLILMVRMIPLNSSDP
jgi:hypothetical protein